jgi:hypothetical protein
MTSKRENKPLRIKIFDFFSEKDCRNKKSMYLCTPQMSGSRY